ncbi:MAG TPA: hypothetical protein VKP65_07730 [Rhodothermales bacterium]|nr:hypothetical protein [Rhodothermales bacterium]
MKDNHDLLNHVSDKLLEIEMAARRNIAESKKLAEVLDQPIGPDTIRCYDTGRRVRVFYYEDGEKDKLRDTTLTAHSCTPMGIYGFDMLEGKKTFIAWGYMAYHRPAVFYGAHKDAVSTRFSEKANHVLSFMNSQDVEQVGVVDIIESVMEEVVENGYVSDIPDDWVCDWATNIRDAAQAVIDHLTPKPEL